jgi:signal transduction histidine kinase/AmiR/NasT family two-component response regulator
MDRPAPDLFDVAVWHPALEKYGAVTEMSVSLFGADEAIVYGPVPITPIVALFEQHGVKPAACAECVRACLAQAIDDRPPVVVATSSGLAVVGISLLLDRQIVGALIAGYAPVAFCESVGISRLARETGTPFQDLWSASRKMHPISARRLVQHGELLQVLGDSLLGENRLRRHSEETAAQLTMVATVKEGFLAVLSHELRTPLTPILGWASILKQQSDPKVVHAAEVIERNAVFQLRMVEDLLELTRNLQGKLVLNLKVVSLNGQVGAALEAVADVAFKKDITVEFIDATEPLSIHADGDRVQQVLRNVLLNALKFTQAGGAVTVTLTREGNEGIVEVRDNGEGIAPEFLPFVFQMFQQQERGTRRTHPGLGIGLALVKQLTEAHGGAVRVASGGVGLGAEVTTRWPLTAAPEGVVSVQGSPDHLALDGLRMLVVEDMDDSREAMCVMLERFGANVVSATNGIEALERATGEDIDVILCDLRMPLMDGFEFLRAFHGNARRRHPPVIAVSGLASSVDHLATQAAGFTGHIDKPFDEGTMLAAVRCAIAARRTGRRKSDRRLTLAQT